MDSSRITEVLNRMGQGEPEAGTEAWELLYPEMVRLAKAERRRWEGNWTLETRALVNEAYVKLFGQGPRDYTDRAHFFRLTSRAVRQVLVNYARSQKAAKRGGPGEPETLHDELAGLSSGIGVEMLELDQALERLAAQDVRLAEIVNLRFFAGLTHPEIAETLDISLATVGRDWVVAKAWLSRELGDSLPEHDQA